MPADIPLLDPCEIIRRPMRLSELLNILASGVFERDMCAIFTEVPDARAVDDPMCVVDDPVQINDDAQEIMPAYATAEGLDLFCLVYVAIDTIYNTSEQQPDAGMDTLLMNIDHYLAHDTWMDLQEGTPTL